MQSLAEFTKGRLPHQFKLADLFLVLSAIPILVMFVLAPETFGLSWAGFGKLGRGGLLFVLFFLGFELMDFRKTAKPRLNRTRKIGIAILVGLGLFYFCAVVVVEQFTGLVYSIGKILGAAGEVSNSWLMATDYLVLTVYIVALTVSFFGPRVIVRVLTPIIFSVGMLVMYILDAFLPYGSIGPLQFWANFIVAGVGLLAKGFGLPIYGYSNILSIVGKHGQYRLIVFWPSVGVHSMLIYSLVMVLLAARLYAPMKRKLIYAAVGIAGTIFLNVFRIFLIAYYGYAYATSGNDLDAFHNSIGEFLFPLWIIVFLLIVLSIEGRLSARQRRMAERTPQTSTTRPLDPAASQPRETASGAR